MLRPLPRPLTGSMLLLGCAVALRAFAASGDSVEPSSSSSAPLSGFGTVMIEQQPLQNLIGSWSLLGQQSDRREGKEFTQTLSGIPAGNYTFFAVAPQGMSAALRLYRGSELVKFVDRSQMSFALQGDDNLRISISYTMTRAGQVSIETDPAGIAFTMTGPNNMIEMGVTPQSFLATPEGQYKVQFTALKGCVTPAPQSLYLEKDSRISFSLKIVCVAASKLRDEQNNGPSSKFVTIIVDGRDIVLQDVPQEAWFAPYVFNVARKGVLAGYRDDAGVPTGVFGPGNSVTVAELAKIALTMVGTADTALQGAPDNRAARGFWFSPYIAAAEARGWTIYSDATIDPVRPATRGEVLVTLLQALNVPLQWQTGSVFTDVTARTPFSAAIETAASAKLVSGKQDDLGKSLGTFGPLDAVNRAEMAKILDLALTTYGSGLASSSSAGPR